MVAVKLTGTRRVAIATAVVLFATSCASGAAERPLDGRAVRAVDRLLADPLLLDAGDVSTVEALGDRRLAWVLVDILRFHQGQTHGPAVARALSLLTGVSVEPYEGSWVRYADDLMRRDVPAPPGYLKWKRTMFVGFHERWAPFFDDRSPLDWRHVTWGGVLRDGIPSLNDPPVTSAARADPMPSREVIFGVDVDGEQRAYPRRLLEAHEIVNDTLGGRRIGLTYCTLCGAAIAYLLDGHRSGQPIELRTSGLLNRSNKLMYDAGTESLFEQFSGRAVAGPLREERVQLERIPMTVTTWANWRKGHPETTVLPLEIGGRTYLEDQLGGRDDDGPVFPVGRIDPRLEAQTRVLGATTADGQAVAFPVAEATAVLKREGRISLAGVELRLLDGAPTVAGPRATAHQAFWFAWSQFHPGTLLWREEAAR